MRTKMKTPEQERAAYRGLKTSAIALILDCSETHVRELIQAGKLRAIDIGTGERNEYRVMSDALDEFLNAAVVKPAA